MPTAGNNRTFLRTSKAAHLKTERHKEALLFFNNKSASDVVQNTDPVIPAQLSFIGRLDDRPSKAAVSMQSNSISDDALAGVQHFNNRYFDSDGDQIMFSAGAPLDDDRSHRIEIQRQMESLSHISHSQFGHFSEEFEEDLEDHPLETALDMMALESDDDDAGFTPSTEDENEWAPHGSKTMFMLDLLDNLPRLRLSDDQLKSIIWVMRECRTPNVPTFSALRKRQAAMTREINIDSQHHTSSLGNHFFMNHPAKLLSLDWGNPLVRPFIHLYPDVSGPVSEFWHAGKWTDEVGIEELSPMWADWQTATSHRHYYIKELAQLADEKFVIPLRWVTVNGVVHMDIYHVEYAPEVGSGDSFCIRTNRVDRIPAKTLESNFLDLSKSYAIRFTEYSPVYEMPHPLRKIAQGHPIFRLRVMPWSDDVSGNVSKQYNAHTNIYVTNLNLPHQKLAQEYFVRFCSTSPHASSSEQFVALGDDFKPGIWHEAYDCLLEEEILFEIIPHVLPADNPQQSETSSHIGMAGSLGCRRDLTGGSKEHQETDQGYQAMYMVWMACLGNKSAVEESQTLSGVKDKISQHWIKLLLEEAKDLHQIQLSTRETRDPRFNDTKFKGDARNALKIQIKRQIQQKLWDHLVQQPYEFVPLLENDRIDPHRDTPGEILHTYLLGNDKYVWHDTTKSWDPKKEETFASRLQASCLGGLSIPPPRPRYVVQYKNSLIGKHFKMLQQLAVFHIHDLCSPLVFDLWKATGELGALLWYPIIKDMDSYLVDLQILIDNVLDIWGLIDPNKILVKGKLHVLAHLVDDVRRFGPAILYSTEIFECWNRIFRLCSILSNHAAPSRDIAVTLGDMERFKHMVSGGWWKSGDGRYVQAGPRVATFLQQNKELQRRLGWCEQIKPETGTVKLESSAKRNAGKWDEAAPFNINEPASFSKTWVHGKYVASQSGDCCSNGSWKPFAGRIVKILAAEGSDIASAPVSIIIEPFTVSSVRDKRLNMPVLVPSTTESNVDRYLCIGRNERILTDNTQQCIIHSPEQRYILNMHGLHNAHLIREVLPRALISPVPYLTDRVASHARFAQQLRVSGPAKRAATQAKTRQTKEQNKRKRTQMESEQASRQRNENGFGSDSEGAGEI
ncbi:hypothetical protein B0H11DRAFT_2405755 [Mycena galericulata]|nr:hypothetical protein B0H11DRAFT_2405755 [Mycena galericulata]